MDVRQLLRQRCVPDRARVSGLGLTRGTCLAVVMGLALATTTPLAGTADAAVTRTPASPTSSPPRSTAPASPSPASPSPASPSPSSPSPATTAAPSASPTTSVDPTLGAVTLAQPRTAAPAPPSATPPVAAASPAPTPAPAPTADRLAAASSLLSDGIYQPPHASAIYQVLRGSSRQLSFDQWAALGAPTPLTVATSVTKHAWSPDLFAVTAWPDRTTTDRLDGAGWLKLGYRSPVEVAVVPGTTFLQWGTSAEIFAQPPGGARSHRLTFGQWNGSGSPMPERRAQQGWVKLSWAPGVAFSTDLAGSRARVVGFAEWTAAGSPTPRESARFPGDRFFTYPGAPPIYYEGATAWGPVSFREWRAAGFPSPNRL